MEKSQAPVEVFYSFAEADAPLLEQLEHHLSILQHEGLISTWHRDQIAAGRDRQAEVDRHLNTASLILLLVSSDFLASHYQVELQRAIERVGQSEAHVIPILLRPCDWEGSPFEKFQMMPRNGKAITSWRNGDAAFAEVARELRAFLKGKQLLVPPDTDDEASHNTYHVQIDKSQGIVIGNNAQVTQHFHESYSEPQIDLVAAEVTYRQKVVEMYSLLSFSGFDLSDSSLTNVPLENIFVRLSLTRETVIRKSEPEEPLRQLRGDREQINERIVTVQEPIELDQALRSPLLLIGEPGAGKSTLIRWLAVTFAQKRQQEPDRVGVTADAGRLPILVELGQLPSRFLKLEGGEVPNWLQLIPEYLNAQMAFTDTPLSLLKYALAEGRCLLLFDGLDEIADRQVRARIAHSLAELARISFANQIVISSRPGGISESVNALRPQFQRCQIERFTPIDVQNFFHFWYMLDHSLTPEKRRISADTLFDRLNTFPAILQLATNPLFSTILLLIWRNDGNLPERRVDLYERCCKIIIEDWENHHHINYQGIFSHIGWERHLRLLAPLAYLMQSQGQQALTNRKNILPLLTHSLQIEGICSSASTALLQAEFFLSTLSLRSGLLQYIGHNKYRFAHQTFQEYLAARYIADQPDPDYIDLVMNHLHESWWQEVHLLTIAHLGSREDSTGKASTLLMTILHLYLPPCWILRSSHHEWVRLIGLGRLFPQIQLKQRIAKILHRETGLVAQGSAECLPNGITEEAWKAISEHTKSFLLYVTFDPALSQVQIASLPFMWQILQRLGSREVVERLMEMMLNESGRISQQAEAILRQIGTGNKIVVKGVIDALKVLDRYMRIRIVERLGRVGKDNEEVIKALINILSDTDQSDIHWQVAESLGQVGGNNIEVIGALLRARHAPYQAVRMNVAKSLGQVDKGNSEVLWALLMMLRDLDRSVSQQAVMSLGQIGEKNEVVIKVLLNALRDSNENLRESAAMSLGQIGKGNKEVVQALLEALRDPNQYVRWRTAVSLGQVGKGSKEVIQSLLKAASDPNRYVRRRVIESLGQVGENDEEVVQALIQMLSNSDNDVRIYVVKSLGYVGEGNDEVMKALLNALLDSDWGVQESAVTSLAQIGKDNEKVAQILLRALHHPSIYVRRNAARALWWVGKGSEVIQALLKALHDTDETVRKYAITSLGEMKITNQLQQRRVLIALNRMWHDRNDDLRSAALVSIQQLMDGQPIPGYRWIPLRKQRERRKYLKRTAFWLSMTTITILIALIANLLLGTLGLNGFPLRFLAVLSAILASLAAIAQILGRTLRNPCDHS